MNSLFLVKTVVFSVVVVVCESISVRKCVYHIKLNESKPNTIYHLFVVARKKITLQMSHDTDDGASKQTATIKLCAVVFVVHGSTAVFNEKNRYAKTLAVVVLRNVTTATQQPIFA